MKCWNHKNRDAAGICSYCGMAVCRACSLRTRDGRLACSPGCRTAINKEKASALIVPKELSVMNRAQVWLLGVTAVAFAMFGAFVIAIGLWPIAIYAFLTAMGFLGVGAFWWFKLRQATTAGRGQ